MSRIAGMNHNALQAWFEVAVGGVVDAVSMVGGRRVDCAVVAREGGESAELGGALGHGHLRAV